MHPFSDLTPRAGDAAVPEEPDTDTASLQVPSEPTKVQPEAPPVQSEAEPPEPEPEAFEAPSVPLTPPQEKTSKPPENAKTSKAPESVSSRQSAPVDIVAVKPQEAANAPQPSHDASTDSVEPASAMTGSLAESEAEPVAGVDHEGGDGLSGQGQASGAGSAPGEGRGLGQGLGDGHGPGSGQSGSGDGRGSGGGGLISFGSPGGPEVARMVMPEYPREARRLGKEGTVVLKISLDAAGEVTAVDVLETPGYGLDESAREAVLRSRFRPAKVGGMPVPCQAILPVHFRLR